LAWRNRGGCAKLREQFAAGGATADVPVQFGGLLRQEAAGEQRCEIIVWRAHVGHYTQSA